jgi:hypothetical protein
MIRSSRGALLVALLAVILGSAGCGQEKPAAPNEPLTGGPGRPKGPMMGGPGRNSPVRKIMSRLDRGPEALHKVIDQDLKAGTTPWDSLQAKTKEYAELAAELSKLEPARGSKESWEKLTADFATAATELDSAVKAKDLDKAKDAYKDLNPGKCKACHEEHRQMGGKGPRGPRGKPAE